MNKLEKLDEKKVNLEHYKIEQETKRERENTRKKRQFREEEYIRQIKMENFWKIKKRNVKEEKKVKRVEKLEKIEKKKRKLKRNQ